jgi:hypothetical protein
MLKVVLPLVLERGLGDLLDTAITAFITRNLSTLGDRYG